MGCFMVHICDAWSMNIDLARIDFNDPTVAHVDNGLGRFGTFLGSPWIGV